MEPSLISSKLQFFAVASQQLFEISVGFTAMSSNCFRFGLLSLQNSFNFALELTKIFKYTLASYAPYGLKYN